MPAMSQLWANFSGGFYEALSQNIAAETAVNVFTETRQVPGSPKQITMYGTPGLDREATVATVGCRGWFTQDGRTWVVVGAVLYERTSAGTYSNLGTIADDGLPVSFASNGQGGDQVGIVGGGELKVFDTGTDTLSAAITIPFVGPVMMTFLDGYGLINQADSPIVWFSALEDFTMWDALDFFARSGVSDNIVGIAVTRDRVWTLGTKTTTQFYDSGDADTPFLPYPGTTTQVGLRAPWLLKVYGDVLYWVGQSASGGHQVYRAVEPQAEPISTPPIDLWLERCTTLDDAEALIYEQAGHLFYIITAPSSPDAIQAYGYDVREQLWHARADWDSTTGVYQRWRVRGCTSVNGEILVGDYASGKLYTLDLDTYTNDEDVLMRERAAPYLSAEAEWVFVDQFELGMQAGVGLSSGQGSAPVTALDISRDGGHTWVSAGTASLGAIGDYLARAIWRRLGRSRADRLVVRARQSDPVKCVMGPGAWLRLTKGTGQL